MASEMAKRSPSLENFCRPQSAIRLLAFMVFLGSIFIWIVKPTNTFYLNWRPELESQTRSAYFGSQGAYLLIFCFPVLFIAVLGCVYVHIAKKANSINPESNDAKYKNPIWKRPVLVKGPLGIVSAIELVFFVMFVALLVWSLSSYLKSGFSRINKQSAAKSGHQVWQEKLESAALRIGLVGNICLAFLFFPVARGSSVLPLLGLTSESCIKYHIWIGHIVMTLFTLHGAFYVIYWASTHQISEMLKWDKIGISNFAGEISLLGGLLLWGVTVPRIRRKAFEVFFYTHYLYIVFVVFFVFHVGMVYTSIVLPGLYLFLLDRYLRFLQSRRHACLLSARVLPCDSLELNFSKTPGLAYSPTSIMFINIPSYQISHLQWHPFTITSNSNLEPDNLSVVIKSEGSWSQKLYRMLSSSPTDRLHVSVEGPYGPASTNYLRYETLVMVSGGSGITPFISIIRELIYQSTTSKCKTPKVKLICSFKNSTSLSMLDLILPLPGTPSELSNLQIQIEAFITRDTGPKPDNNLNRHLRAIWFKPHSTDAPISAVLGPSHWLWLAAIISSSFILYLIIIGIINRCYIYPIEHNSDGIFSYPLKSFLNMLVICAAIGVTCSATFLWNKKQNAKEATKIQNMEGPSPTVSPASMTTFNADREMESLPYQSLVQATNVHYGERPDLKRMILEHRDESSVGVLVSGPRRMRQEVAAICSRGLAENLHFESISFSW
ncbi:LOW QUALITY PROTEIN: ferric reduction oxidase 2-like [Neltuma alba]|uniref:LOW QUALITY PROTEIN: ferric reduction oxidase 2-like n=1 Tax=Neltuma alba TaxID=207710 RepID=UPI0010A3DF0F|nr:LOW QUALITY PROTEIN: ferric reduction oxidase 2-like [Prosopis alba]